MASSSDLPKAIVLSCLGAAESDLSVTRSLGRRGVPVVVVSEYEGAPATLSRYCAERYCLPLFTLAPEKLLEFLLDYARRQPQKPILFPTADPDLLLVSKLRPLLASHYHLPLASPELIDLVTDKQKFSVLASQKNLPVPATHMPRNVDELRRLTTTLQYPIVVKPPHPLAWSSEIFNDVASGKKALIAANENELVRAGELLIQRGCAFLIQEYVPGSDAEHYELHAYLDASSTPLAWFTGQKIRISPPHAGSGCFVQSRYVDAIVTAGLNTLRSIGFTGLANLDFKRDPLTGNYRLLEINPRVSQWNILGAECGINLPYIAYADVLGLDRETPGPQRENVYYINFRNDLRSFFGYRRDNEWSCGNYLRSLLRRPMVYQLWRTTDPWPLISSCANKILRIPGRLLRRVVAKS